MGIENIKYTQPLLGNTTDNPVYISGGQTLDGQTALTMADLTVRELMEQILMELKKLNLCLQTEFGERIENEDIV